MNSEKRDELAAALVKLQGELPIIKKSSTSYKGKYAPLESFVKAAQPLLLKHGLAVVFGAVRVDNTVMLEGTLIHVSGQWLSKQFPFTPGEPTSQADGSANTYARRYLFCNLLGMVAEGEDDDAAAQQQKHEKEIKPRDPNKPISDKQITLLRMHMNNKENLEEIICKRLEIDSLAQLRMGQFNEALKIAKWLHDNMN